MKKILLAMLFLILILCGCGNQANKATLPISYEDAIGENYETVISYFEKAGFANIELEPADDLLNKSDYYRVDTIKEIEINGSTEFEKDKKLHLSSNIVIKYHTYAKCEIPTSMESVKGMAYEEIEKLFMNSKFFNIQNELILDIDKDNVNDKEVEYITVDGKEKFAVNDTFPVDSDIIVYYSYIEESLPILSSEAKGKAYEEVAGLFADSKFEVEFKLINDVDGDNVYEDEIEYIEINSISDYTLEDKYPINSKVIIYHSYIEDKMPITSSEAKGMNYQEALKMFEATKFNNIKTKTEAGTNVDVAETTVEKITINGSENYSSDQGYPYNSEICIYYSVKKYDVSLQLECSENWIFNTYDVLVYVDGDKIGTLDHGETKTFKLQLPKGAYDLVLKSAEDSSVQGTKTFNIKADRLLRYAVYCNGSNVKLTYYKQLKVPYTNEDGINKNVDDVVKAFEAAEYDVTKKALNDLKVNNLGKSNTVSEIKINESNNFTKDSVFYKGADVVVYYHSGQQIKPPMSSSEAKGTDYNSIVKKFKDAGFVNVSAEIYTGRYDSNAQNYKTESVTIDGYKCSDSSKYSIDAKVVVYYYYEEILTLSNCKELRSILDGTYSEAENKAFIEKYKGYAIEFDAIMSWNTAIEVGGGGSTGAYFYVIYNGNKITRPCFYESDVNTTRDGFENFERPGHLSEEYKVHVIVRLRNFSTYDRYYSVDVVEVQKSE